IGIARFEILNGTKTVRSFGIADESVSYGRGEAPSAKGQKKIVEFNNVYIFTNDWIQHFGGWIKGNTEYIAGDRISMELNMVSKPRTLTFFVNDQEQKNYIINIPSAVRIWVFLFLSGESFKLLKFEWLLIPSAKHKTGSRALKWGKKWK
ncbi:MAG: hypothetical protein EZS28_029213, partial [Streblomastix strix]